MRIGYNIYYHWPYNTVANFQIRYNKPYLIVANSKIRLNIHIGFLQNITKWTPHWESLSAIAARKLLKAQS